MEGILELVDERYSKVLGQVTLRGMRENAKRGFLNGSKPAYGYQVVKVVDERGNPKAKLSPYEPETGAVRKIFDLCLNGYGMRNILRQLDELGFRARNGKRFKKGLVESILKNEVYTGTLKFVDIRVENAHSPVIDPGTFQRAQEMLLERKPKKGGAGYTASPYGFSGMLYCSKCGENLSQKRFSRGKKFTLIMCAQGRRTRTIRVPV